MNRRFLSKELHSHGLIASYVEQAEKSESRCPLSIHWNSDTRFWISQVLSRAAVVGNTVFNAVVDAYSQNCQCD